jgi:hypothetical protein
VGGVLKWKTVTVTANGGPVTITVTGNVDTRVVTRYFWLPKSDDQSQQIWDRNDGQALLFDTALIAAGQNNHLGFSCRLAPVVRTETSLVVMLQVRQGNTIVLENQYALTTTDPTVPVSLDDGITLAI